MGNKVDQSIVVITPQEVQSAHTKVVRTIVGKVDLVSMEWMPWPRHEAKRLSIEARKVYFTHSHQEDADLVPRHELLQCLACRIRGRFGMPPAIEGWERLAIQACQPIQLRYINAVLRHDDPNGLSAYPSDYRDNLARDIMTFGLAIHQW